MDTKFGMGEPTTPVIMSRIPIYEVIDQRCVASEPSSVGRYVLRPLTGDECTVTLTDVQMEESIDRCECSFTACFVEAAADSCRETRHVLVLGEADCTVGRGLEAVLACTGVGELREFCLGDGWGGRVSGRVRLSEIRKCAGGSGGWRGDDRLKLLEATRHKIMGNRLYRQGRYADAFHRFNRSVRAVLFIRNVDEVRDARDELYATVCNNMAACQLHLGNFDHAYRLSDKALAVHPDNLKAMVRRCRASAELKMFDGALADARSVLGRDPGNGVARHYLDVAARAIEAQNADYKHMVKKMFA